MTNSKMHITQREFHVVLEVLQGKTSNEIAESLFVTHHTVKAHLKNIFYKTGTVNKLDFVITLFGALTKNSITTQQILNALNTLAEEQAKLFPFL